MKLPNYTLTIKSFLLLIAGGFIPAFLLGTIVGVIKVATGDDYTHEPLFIMLSTLVLWLGAIVTFNIHCKKQTNQPLKFNLSLGKPLNLAIIFPMMLGMMFIVEYLTSLLPTEGKFWGELYKMFQTTMEIMMGKPLFAVVMVCIIAPIFEEIVFRGIIQKGLINKGMKPQLAILLAAIVFAIVHGNPWQFLGAILLGYALGAVYFRTGSLLLSILLHFFNNAMALMIHYLIGKESWSDVLGISPVWILVLGFIIFGVFHTIFIKMHKGKK